MTQGELAKAAKLSQSTIGNLEAGIRSSGRKIALIASILEVDALWLAEGVGQPDQASNNMKLVASNDDTATSPEEYAEAVRLFGQAPKPAKEEALRLLRSAIKARSLNKSGVV